MTCCARSAPGCGRCAASPGSRSRRWPRPPASRSARSPGSSRDSARPPSSCCCRWPGPPGAARRAGRRAADRRPAGPRPADHRARPDDPAAEPQPGWPQAFKHIIAAGERQEPEPKTHEGYEWLYVLSGRLRLILGEHDLVLPPGEAAEFDTRVPHWFGSAGGGPVEFLTIFDRQGARIHVRHSARPSKPRQ
jgi:mannose-6-phosphate isomerase-like protein (cupin superfamily)